MAMKGHTKKILVLFSDEFKIKSKALEPASKINNPFGPGAAKGYTAQRE